MYELDKNIFNMHMALFFAENADVPVFKVAQKLQDDFKQIFPGDPEMLPLPADAPKEIPRCTFKNDRNTTMTIALNRMDFDGGFKVGTDWKNYITIILLNFLRTCSQFGIAVVRLGVVVKAKDDGSTIAELNRKVSIDGFDESEEKSVFYVSKKSVDDILFNVVTNLIYNEKSVDASEVVSIDVNTDISNNLPSEVDKQIEVVQLMIDEVEGKLKNVF